MRLSQLVLSGMRERREGRIVNVSSIGGKLVFPGVGAYEGAAGKLLAAGPEAVARTIEKAISRRRSRVRSLVTSGARVMLAQRRLLPDRLRDLMMSTAAPRPK